ATPTEAFRLVAVETGRELARLDDPQRDAGAAAFTPDGTRLVATSRDGLRVWDLRAIRRELAVLGLDWDAPPYPPDDPAGPAGRDYTAVLDREPGDRAARYQRGLIALARRRPAAALADFDDLVRRSPDDGAARYRRARALVELGRHAAAVPDLDRLIAAYPK